MQKEEFEDEPTETTSVSAQSHMVFAFSSSLDEKNSIFLAKHALLCFGAARGGGDDLVEKAKERWTTFFTELLCVVTIAEEEDARRHSSFHPISLLKEKGGTDELFEAI